MGDEFVPPVRALLKAIDAGIKIAGRLVASASRVPAGRALQISDTAQYLQISLTQSSQAIVEAYRQNVAICGEPFTKALVEDNTIQKQLQDLKNEVRDKIDDIEEDSEMFDPATCVDALEEAKNCSATCVNIFEGLREQLHASQRLAKMRLERLPTLRKPLPPTSRTLNCPDSPTEPLQINNTVIEDPPRLPARTESPCAINGASHFHLRTPARSGASSAHQRQRSSRDISPPSPPDGDKGLIPREAVRSRVDANDEFLERRRQSKLSFLIEMRKSVSSIDEERERKSLVDVPRPGSPNFGSATIATSIATSPVEARSSRLSLSGHDILMTREKSQGQASQGTRSSRTSSILQDTCQSPRQDSRDSILGLRAAPLSPPLSEHGTSIGSGGTETWRTLVGEAIATTLQTPDFGKGVEPGIEVVTGIDHENEKIAVGPDEYHHPTPTASMESVDCPIRHDTSFYKFGGFCEGSKAVLRGENGFKIVKRPAGHYSATISARCVKCSYEIGWNDVEKDRLLERSGIHGSSGIRWRQRFISKCHVKTNSLKEPVYACIFCIDEHKTIEDHDATVFFSVPQLLRHLAKHPRPLPAISGITILYGFVLPEVVDFDIHFTTAQPTLPPYSMSEIAQKVATRPSGQATSNHHPKNERSSSRDPEGHPVLKFANGARIVGITFPERFGGKWCVGYHDGDRGAFPAGEIMLEMPAKEDVLMNPQSSLLAVARWDFKPKDMKDGGWLRFSKGDRISCIGYTFQDQWCWSGQSSKGKWGLFPAAFVEGLQDGGRSGTSPRLGSSSADSNARSGFGLSGRIPSFPRSRHRSPRQQAGSNLSIRSSGSAGSMNQQQAGLEVVQ
ncbi:uncharacterized protein L3040_006180 [Drepanopeziza brunnea f. sp. 'multigermtubi']|nr:hypothetical protein L3040_006180 [Drepanopeziza brunnea f. sp. 'multigermtubi']